MPGRLEVVPGAPEVVLDGAHNPAGVRALVDELPAARRGTGPVVAVVSALAYKDVEGMVAALAPAAALVVATRSSHPGAPSPHRIARLAREAGAAALVVEEPAGALARAREEAGPDGTCWWRGRSTCSGISVRTSWRATGNPLLDSRPPGRAMAPPSEYRCAWRRPPA